VTCWAGPKGTARRLPARRAEPRSWRRKLEREREAARLAERERRRAEKEAEAERRRVEKDLEARVAALEKTLPGVRAAAARAAAEADTPPPDVRSWCRAYLAGRLPMPPADEPMRVEAPLSHSDAAANTWLAAQVDAAQVAALVHERLGLGPLFDRVDAVEVECWAGFMGRVRKLAGEA
jgi:hypothetical protein